MLDETTAVPARARLEVRGSLLWIAAAGLALAVTGAAASFAPDLARHGRSGYAWSGVVMASSDLLLLLGVIALTRSVPSARGRLWSVASVLAIAGSAASVVAEVLLRIDFGTGTTAFGVAGPAQALGFIGLGVCLLRSGAWPGWRRCSLLALGLYVPVVLVPALAASGGQNLAALAGFHCLVLLVGAAWLTTPDR